MWSEKISKLCVFLLLMVLVNISTGETTLDSLTYDNQPQDFKEDAVIVENLNSGSENGIKELENSIEFATELANSIEDVKTTESPNNDPISTESIETTTNQIECVCDCTANGNQVTVGCSTQSPEEIITETTEQTEETTKQTEETTSANNDSTLPNIQTTKSSLEEEITKDSINTETTSESNEEKVTSTTTAESETTSKPETTTLVPPPICSTPGVQPNDLNCQQYNDCSLEGSLDGSFHLLTKSCPEKQAFNIELNRCSRDISSCSLPIQCVVKGGVADPVSNTSYYLCEPRLIGAGFRIFHVDCASHEIFYPELGKCFIDLNNLSTQSLPPFVWNQIRDIDIVKAEMKLLKEQDKMQLKQEKDRRKAEEKLQKELEKETKKKAKEEEKLNKEKAKVQAASIVCNQEGNYASEIAENIYYACITKKGKLKAIPMQCGFGATFNSETGTCINTLPYVNASVSDEDDDDD